MGNGYVRQSAADIVTGNTILPVHFNNEFNALRDAFDGVDGHSHDGTTGEGQKINLKTAITDTLDIVNGGTGAVNAGAARINLGLAIGTNVQAYDAGLQSIAGLTTAADQMIYTTASDVYATTALTPFARTLLDDTTAVAFKTTLALQNVDNTSDANKPVSTLQQTALNLKANKAGDTFTGTVILPAATTTLAPLRIPAGTSPTSPTDGDIWNTSTGIMTRTSGVTRTQYDNVNLPAMTQALAEAGTDTTNRTVQAIHLKQSARATTGLELIASYSSAQLSGVSNIVVDLPSMYSTYKIITEGLSTTNPDTVNLRCAVPGQSFETGASDYFSAVHGTSNNSVIAASANANLAPIGICTQNGLLMSETLLSDGSSSPYWKTQTRVSGQEASGAYYLYSRFSFLLKTPAARKRLAIFTGSGQAFLANGSVRIYGVK